MHRQSWLPASAVLEISVPHASGFSLACQRERDTLEVQLHGLRDRP